MRRTLRASRSMWMEGSARFEAGSSQEERYGVAVLLPRGRGGRIGSRRCVHIHKPFVHRIAGRVAIPVGGVGGSALFCAILAARGLRILPDRRGRNTTLRHRWSGRKGASGRRWARVVENPED